MRPRFSLIFALLAALLLPNITAITQEDKLEVIASYSILADVVYNVAGDHVELTTLIPTGADPHGFQPSPRDLTPLSEADVIFVNGGGFEESLLEVIAGAAEDVPIVEVSACVEIIPIGASGHMHEDDDHADEDEHGHDEDDDDHADEDDDHGHDHDDDDHADEDEHGHDEDDDDHADEDDEHGHDEDDDVHADEHDDEHMHDDMHSHCDDHDAEFLQIYGGEDVHEHGPVLGRLEDIDCGGHAHDHGAHVHAEGGCDPHVWMDPHNIIFWSLTVRDILSELDPGHAPEYAAAAADYIGELVALEADFILPLLEALPVEKRILITSHDSLGYLATTYDFVIVSTVIPGGSTQVEPSASDVSTLVDLVKDSGVAAIFGETTVSTSIVETIAAETGAEMAVIYSGTLSVDGPASTYLDYMRYNLTTIVESLGAGA